MTPQELFPALYNEDLMDEGINFSFHDMCNFAQDYYNEANPDTIPFTVYLTGHDEETIKQMYNDFKRYQE